MIRTAFLIALLLSVTSLIGNQQNSPPPAVNMSPNQGTIAVSAQQDKKQKTYTIIFVVNQQAQSNNMPIVNNQQALTQNASDKPKEPNFSIGPTVHTNEGWGEAVLNITLQILRKGLFAPFA